MAPTGSSGWLLLNRASASLTFVVEARGIVAVFEPSEVPGTEEIHLLREGGSGWR